MPELLILSPNFPDNGKDRKEYKKLLTLRANFRETEMYSVGIIMISHNLNMTSEAKEIREYTDKQESRCLGLLNRLSRIQIGILDVHTEEQLASFVSQPTKKFGVAAARVRSMPFTKYDPAGFRSIGISSADAALGLGSTISNSLFVPSYTDSFPNVITKPKEPKRRRRNPLHDSPLWKIPEITEMKQVTSKLNSVLHHTSIGNLDLDETESSSGDSSCDETMFVQEDCDGTPRRLTHYLPVEDNPLYKFAEDRAKIIAQWTWLQDAIANLSYKIKQQEEFAKHLVAAKPPFQFEEHQSTTNAPRPQACRPPSNPALKDACIQIFTANNNSQVPPTSTQVFYAGERKSPYITDAAGKVIQLVPPSYESSGNVGNSFNKSVVTPTPTSNTGNSVVGGGLESLGLTIPVNDDPSCTARRCMPLKPFKQRKIYQLGGIHNMSSFAGRAPTLLCTCFGRTELCAVCTGRARKTKVIEVEVMDPKEVHELLDHNYHRTLSLPDETPVPALIESALKREGWTGRRQRKKMKFKRLSLASERPRPHLGMSRGESEIGDEGIKKRPRGRPRLPREIDEYGHVTVKHPKHSVTLAGNKRQSWRKDRRSGGGITRRASYAGDISFRRRSIKIGRKKYNSVSEKGLTRKRERDALISDEDSPYDPDFNYEDFDCLAGNKSDKRLSQAGRKLNQDYDIDNIVIPYSIASSTRVEKIEYKEILTPSWRVVANFDPEEYSIGENLEMVEEDKEVMKDLSEENIKLRHDRCEANEHKKFNSIPDKSSRRGRRLDSRTESLEQAPNPDDSPEDSRECDTPAPNSFPASPSPPTYAPDDNEGFGIELVGSSISSRKRTVSSASAKNDEEAEENQIEFDGVRAIPFEPRKFPLTDEEYELMSREILWCSYETLESPCSPPSLVPCFRLVKHDDDDAEKVKENDDDGEMELMELGEDSDEDDPDWQRAPGERAA